MPNAKGIGRPTKPAKPGEKASLGLKVRAAVKAALEEAAIDNGRSQSQEAEFRLETSFERSNLHREVLSLMYGSQLAAILMMIGTTMRDVGPKAEFARTMSISGSTSWLDDPYAFDQAARAVTGILEALRPEGSAQTPNFMTASLNPALADIAERVGSSTALDVIDAVNGHGISARLRTEGEEIADMLGPIAKRLKKKGRPNAR